MQTLRPGKVESARRVNVQERSRSGRLGTIAVACALLGAWSCFVNALAEIDADTLFLAVYCTMLSMFILKAFIDGVARRSQY